jgi:protein-S-isoprenylcysteine O-methyltransferase Ste14
MGKLGMAGDRFNREPGGGEMETILIAPPKPPPVWLRVAVLDRIEQAVIVVLWLWMVERVGLSVFRDGNDMAWLVLVSETPVMVFMLIRRPTQAISLKLGDWLLAIIATTAPMLVQTGTDPVILLRDAGVILVLLGNLGQATAKLALARSFGIAPANRGIKVAGPYRLVRHPMYAGYLVVHIGVLLMMPLPINFVIYAIGWTAQIRRMLAEEALLGADPAYRAYMGQVRWRMVPRVF